MGKAKEVSIDLFNKLHHINDVRFSGDGTGIVWSESIGSQGVIFTKKFNKKARNLSGNLNVRGSVGYGGGDFDVNATQLVFPDRSGSLYIKSLQQNNDPKPITPSWAFTAAPAFSPDGKWVIFCYSSGDTDGLAISRTDGLIWPSQLVLGADFYMQPAWHPSGRHIAWTEWNYPDMPWDASCIKIGELGGMQLRLFKETWIAGGKDHSASQPKFSPNGKWLSYIIRSGDWDNLVLYNLKKRTHKILICRDGFHLRLPDWIQGMRSYCWNADSTALFHFRYSHGESSLWKVDIQNANSEQLDIDPIQWAIQLDVSPVNDDLVFLGSSPKIPKQICIYQKGHLSYSQTDIEKEASRFGSDPIEITFKLKKGTQGYGFFYPPLNSKPERLLIHPLILQVHGGPTSAFNKSFSNDALFFNSLGYAYAVLNYRGSSGNGYSYQEALFHQWGIVDVEDTIAFAHALIAEGLASPDRMAIIGSSAGGFTVLSTLIKHPGFFKAGICSYGVSDLLEDARSTHKFEKYYHQFLVGNLSKNRQRFIDRSPIFHIDKIKDPIALFHGDEDKVVSLNQTLAIYKKLKENSIPCELHVYKGEGHGFRKPESVRDFYTKVEIFLKKYL